MHVLIVDDEPLARDELRYLIEKINLTDTIDEADSVAEAIEKMLDQKPAIVFLDIHLTNENGFDLAEKFKQMKKPPQIIFATAYDEYAIKAFEVDAIDYVLKPFEEKRVRQSIEKALHVIENADLDRKVIVEKSNDKPESIAIQMADRIYLLSPQDILFATVDNTHLQIVTSHMTYETSETLSWLEQKLDSHVFLKTHRSYLVNISAIREIQPWFNHTYQITLINEQKIPVSRSYVKDLRKRLDI